jgi:hypothetical protein
MKLLLETAGAFACEVSQAGDACEDELLLTGWTPAGCVIAIIGEKLGQNVAA